MAIMPESTLNVIGTSVRKIDAIGKVNGQTIYTGDMVLPRMLHCKLLRSRYPHARIKSIDARAALALPGVFTILTGEDLPKKYGLLGTSQDETALAVDKVRFMGDPVAAVAAVDEETAEAAVHLIVVEYEPLAPILDLATASQPPMDEAIHADAKGGNLQKSVALEFGDLAAGFAEADLIQEDLFDYGGNTHVALEEHATLAQVDPDGQLTLWSSTQTPHYLHRAMANYFALPASRIRVIAPPTGGGFGGKAEPFNHEFVVAKLAMITGRPVKIVLTREEVFYLHRGRHPVLMRVKTGVKKDGRITAQAFESILDGGAYGSYGIVSTYYTGAIQTVTYNVPAYSFRGARLLTNKPPCGPKRGHGVPQPRFAVEVQMDKIAEKLAINPLDIRLNHLAKSYTKTANHLSVTTIGLKQCLETVAERSHFRERYGQLPLGRGLGLAASAYITGANEPIYSNKMPHTGVQIQLDRGGGVTVFCGSTDIGQGSNSVLAMIVAEELGVTVDDIHVVNGDTSLTPVDLGSFASRVTLMAGNAALDGARKLRKILFDTAAEIFKVPAASFAAANGIVYCLDDEKRRITFPNLVQLAEAKHGTLGATGSYTPPNHGVRYKGGAIGLAPNYSYSACVAAVTVDIETGELTVEKIWLAHDIGKAINPLLAEGQIEGSIYMGLGEVLMEEQTFRRGLYNVPSILDYKIPTFLEMPEMETILIETHDPAGPYGAKEAGQGALLPVAPAIANAVYDAVGVRIDEVPITAEKIFKALQQKAKGREGRIGPQQMPSIEHPNPLRVASLWGKAVEK